MYNMGRGDNMKLLASDFDNTLWFFDHMKEKDVSAIERFQNAGHLFGICSGRTLSGILKPSAPYHINYDFYILLSGGLIVDKNHQVIFQKKIPFNVVKEVHELYKDVDISIVGKQVYKIFISGRQDDRGISIQTLDEIHEEEVCGFSLHYQRDEISLATKATQYINEQFGAYLSAFQNNEHVDITASGCSKGRGIQIIQDYFHLNHEDICGIGDCWNDLPMLHQVSHGFTFPYAPDQVKQASQTIVEHLYQSIDILMNE